MNISNQKYLIVLGLRAPNWCRTQAFCSCPGSRRDQIRLEITEISVRTGGEELSIGSRR